jgi:hypothetical protein
MEIKFLMLPRRARARQTQTGAAEQPLDLVFLAPRRSGGVHPSDVLL